MSDSINDDARFFDLPIAVLDVETSNSTSIGPAMVVSASSTGVW